MKTLEILRICAATRYTLKYHWCNAPKIKNKLLIVLLNYGGTSRLKLAESTVENLALNEVSEFDWIWVKVEKNSRSQLICKKMSKHNWNYLTARYGMMMVYEDKLTADDTRNNLPGSVSSSWRFSYIGLAQSEGALMQVVLIPQYSDVLGVSDQKVKSII